MSDILWPSSCDDGGRDNTYTEVQFEPRKPCPSGPVIWSGTTVKNNAVLSKATPVPEVYISDQLGPGWRKAKAMGQLLPFTNYGVRRTVFEAAGGVHLGNCYWPSSSIGRFRTGNHCGFSEIRIPDPPDLSLPDVDALLQAAWADAKSDGIDLLTEMAEFPETIKLFESWKDRFDKRADRVAKDARKKRRRGGFKGAAQQYIDDFSNAWMESRYGWRPLVYTANDIRDKMEEWKEDHPFILRRYRKTEKSSVLLKDTPIIHTISGTSGSVGTGSMIDHSITGRALVTTKLVRKSVQNAVTINPLATAYELVPYSFVADWFLNAGDIFRAHWPAAFFEGTAACTSLKTQTKITLGFKQGYDAGVGPSFTEVKFMYSATDYRRTPRSTIPLNLSVRNRLSLAKLTDLSILFKQQLRRRGLRI